MDLRDVYQKYLEAAVRFLSYRPRSEKEVRDYLLKKKAPLEIIEKILNWLKDQRFVNDEEFVKWWIEQRSKFRPKGLKVIKMELRQKGVSQALIDSILQESEINTNSDLESARRIVEKKIIKYKGLDKREIYHKLGAHLARKGFNWETIKRVIDDSLDQ